MLLPACFRPCSLPAVHAGRDSPVPRAAKAEADGQSSSHAVHLCSPGFNTFWHVNIVPQVGVAGLLKYIQISCCSPNVCMQGVTGQCLELQKLKLMGSEAATLYDFAVLDALWSGIVQSSKAMQSFLAADGLGSLLDVLECGAVALKPVLLTIMAGEAEYCTVNFFLCLEDCAAKYHS